MTITINQVVASRSPRRLRRDEHSDHSFCRWRYGLVLLVIGLGGQRLFKTHGLEGWSSTSIGTTISKQNHHERQQQQQQDHYPEIQQLKAAAKQRLQQMDDQREFDIETLTTHEYMLENGISKEISFEPCTIENIISNKLSQKENERNERNDGGDAIDGDDEIFIKIIVIGGSCSARGADNCTFVNNVLTSSSSLLSSGATATTTETATQYYPFARYSDALQQRLDEFTSSFSSITNSSIRFDVTNMGQGATNSIWAGLTLDNLLDVESTDLIIWEYAPNDGYTEPNRYTWMKFHVWLSRLKALYNNYYRHHPTQTEFHLPPIITMYLWEAEISTFNAKKIQSYGFGVPGMIRDGDLHQYSNSYQTNHHDTDGGGGGGWNIQAMTVGSGLSNHTNWSSKTKILLDDGHHVNCFGAQFVGKLIEHTILSNLAGTSATSNLSCSDQSRQKHEYYRMENNCKAIRNDVNDVDGSSSDLCQHRYPPMDLNHPVLARHRSDSETQQVQQLQRQEQQNGYRANVPSRSDLWRLILDENFRTGSITPWEPTISNTDANHSMRVNNRQEIETYSKVIVGKSAQKREDRKCGYIIPECAADATKGVVFTESNSSLKFVLDEPDTEYIGIFVDDIAKNSLVLRINGHIISDNIMNSRTHNPAMVPAVSADENAEKQFETTCNRWIHVPTALSVMNNNQTITRPYTFTICKTYPNSVVISRVVGIMAQNPRGLQRTSIDN